MNERQKKAFDFAADLTKQLITLSTGIVTITLLLSKDFFGPRLLAVAAWAFYLFSTVFGLWALMALTGTLAPVRTRKARRNASGTSTSSASTDDKEEEEFEIGDNVRKPSTLQILSFGLATVLTLAYVCATFLHPAKAAPPPVNNCCCACQPTSPAR
ncbi:MAG: hypothetical protein ABSE45_15715 [Candidatus Acidiferrales bacterium]|jgi:hypothetical protein